jgi:hypothetical protein
MEFLSHDSYFPRGTQTVYPVNTSYVYYCSGDSFRKFYFKIDFNKLSNITMLCLSDRFQ